MTEPTNVERSASSPALPQESQPLKMEPEEVRVDKNIDVKETRLAHICTLCHCHLHKICSTDANISIIAVDREGTPKGWGNEEQSTSSKSESSSSKVSPSVSSSVSPGSGSGSSGAGGGGATDGKGAKNWKKKLEEEEEAKRKRKEEEEEKKRKKQTPKMESTVKPSHEVWDKKKKKDF